MVTEVSTFVFVTQVTNDLKIEYSYLYIGGSRGHAWGITWVKFWSVVHVHIAWHGNSAVT